MVFLVDKHDARKVVKEHLEDIDSELKRRVDGPVRAELLKAKSEALKAMAELFK